MSLEEQLSRNISALGRELARNPGANVSRWLAEIDELRSLAMTEMSCENPDDLKSVENRDTDVIEKPRETEMGPKTTTRKSYRSGAAHIGVSRNPR
jgi:hypothetical protein